MLGPGCGLGPLLGQISLSQISLESLFPFILEVLTIDKHIMIQRYPIVKKALYIYLFQGFLNSYHTEAVCVCVHVCACMCARVCAHLCVCV